MLSEVNPSRTRKLDTKNDVILNPKFAESNGNIASAVSLVQQERDEIHFFVVSDSGLSA